MENLNESYEISFDSAEFDEDNIDEGGRPEYDHEFIHNFNDLKFIRKKYNRTMLSNSFISVDRL